MVTLDCRWLTHMLLIWGVAWTSVEAHARPELVEKESTASCARVRSFEGEVQILDDSRTRVREVRFGEGIPCGSWISATAGWLRIKHRDGWLASFSPGTFAQILNPPSLGGDGLLLFRGQSYIINGNGAPELSVLTANSRVRLKDAAGVVAYIDSTEETQALSTRGTLHFENRFQDTRIVRVAEGESSNLNFHQLRVVPAEPSAVASAQIKKRLEDFRLEDQEVSAAVAVTRKRQDRKIASVLGTPPVPVVAESEKDSGVKIHEDAHKLVVIENPEQMRKSSRETEKPAAQERHPAGVAPGKAASDPGAGLLKSDYSRHPGVGPEQQEEIRTQLAEKVAGHGPVSEDMISPDEGSPESLRAPAAARSGGGLKVTDPDSAQRAPAGQGKRNRISSEDAEKKRLLEELSRIQAH